MKKAIHYCLTAEGKPTLSSVPQSLANAYKHPDKTLYHYFHIISTNTTTVQITHNLNGTRESHVCDMCHVTRVCAACAKAKNIHVIKPCAYTHVK